MSDNTDELINGCVYKITSKVNLEMAYYGSTKNFYKRRQEHKSHYKLYLNERYHYITLWDIFDLGDYSQEIVKFYYGITKKQLRDFETEFIINNKCVNKLQSMTDEMKKEYKQEYDKERYEKNKEILQKQNICDICKGSFTTEHKSHHYQAKKHIKAQELLDEQKKDQETQTEKQEEPKKKIIIKMKPKDSSTININITNN